MGIITQLKPTYLIAGGLTAITLCLGLILRSSIVSADDIIDNVAITVESSCSMSGNINTAHTANLKNSTYSGAEGSTYENGIGKTTLTTFCNDQNGFSIYAVGYTGNVAGNTNLVGASTGSTIPTGTETSGSTSNWAMKVTKVDNPGGQQPDVTYNPQNMTITNSFNTFHAVPAEYTKVAEYHAETGSSATDQGSGALGAKIETTYATYVSADQYADTYTGQVKYVMVHPYNTTTPTMPPNPPATCNTPVPGINYMQEINSTNRTAVLASLTEEAPYFLRDSRDEEPYCVSKLKDGRLWMLDNLRLDPTTMSLSTLKGQTNANDVTLEYLKGVRTGADSDQYAVAGIINDPLYDSSYTTPYIVDTYKDYVDSKTSYNYGVGSHKYGIYYNYCAASAGSYCYDSSPNNTGATEDLCPANWHMPTSGGDYKGVYDLYTHTASDINSAQQKLSTPLSGLFHRGSTSNVRSGGYFWSSTRKSSLMYTLAATPTQFLYTNYWGRDNGLTMRCLLNS